ncbi:aminotransferase class V-fold PLP-dependent enzyme [Candidatus Parcubacteria bacterium]|nr:MAG: aminotransferase class V-fold PLP-dependent enzyme [Candidatus Parcubacteria bacterium]
MIPLYKAYIPEKAKYILSEVFDCGYLAEGEFVRRFEDKLKIYIQNSNLITVGDVSTGILICLYMAGVRPGDEVIASPVACVATNQPVLNLFARVVWCDVDPFTGNIDAEKITDLITDKTKAILYPHWAGDVGDIAAIKEIADRFGIRTIEDAGEAMGAEYKGRKVGNTGSDFTVFSFHAIRHITTGEGAAITFADKNEAFQANCIKRYGIHRASFRDSMEEINPASDIPVAGYNSYLTNIDAAIGIAQLERLPEVVARHRENGYFYDFALKDVPGITLCNRPKHMKSSFWVYTFLAERRDDLLKVLRERNIFASKVHYRNDIYTCFNSKSRVLPGVDTFSSAYLCIPCGWWVSEENRQNIVRAIKRGW